MYLSDYKVYTTRNEWWSWKSTSKRWLKANIAKGKLKFITSLDNLAHVVDYRERVVKFGFIKVAYMNNETIFKRQN